jgi:hypothetical protein
MESNTNNKNKKSSKERQFECMDKGFEMGKINYKSRKEIYERK